MKEIRSFVKHEKYKNTDYEEIRDGIFLHKKRYVTAISFEQEPEYGEGCNASDISQYPLEDLLDKFSVYVSDFFPDLNLELSKICYLEITGFELHSIQEFRSIIGKHVYDQKVCLANDEFIQLVIE